MGKRAIIGFVSAGVVVLGITAANTNRSQPSKISNVKGVHVATPTTKVQPAPKARPICDGTSVTTSCTVEGVNYSTYIYHPAVPEQSHDETVTTYQKKVTGYCTLCADGTYSPTCATGRGACSHHGGVQEWNAPEYSNVAVNSTKKVVDAPAQPEHYEKIAD